MLRQLITAFIIVALCSLTMVKGFEIQNYVEGIMEHVNKHNKQLEILIEKME